MTGASAFVLDGAAIADEALAQVAEDARALILLGVTPGLAVVLVGENPASQTYVAGKGRAAKACGFLSIQHNLSAETSEAELLARVRALNADPAVHGILVQLPLPKHIASTRVLEAIGPAKDVDGFHPINVGLLSIGDTSRALIPCTPAGAMILIDRACERLGWTLPAWWRWWSAARTSSASRWRSCCWRAHCTVTIAHFAHAATCPRSRAARPTCLVAAVGQRRRWRTRRLDQAPGAIGDRRRHQPRGLRAGIR